MAEESSPSQLAIEDAIRLLQTFRGANLTGTIHQIEKSLRGASADGYAAALTTSGAKAEVLGAAGLIKQLAGQINVDPRVRHPLMPSSYPSARRNHRLCFIGRRKHRQGI
jgi:hypothetical protein